MGDENENNESDEGDQNEDTVMVTITRMRLMKQRCENKEYRESTGAGPVRGILPKSSLANCWVLGLTGMS